MRAPLALLLLALVALTAPPPAAAVSPVELDELHWWQKEVIYQIYPRSFKDSGAGTGVGEGDLQGITSNLGYIQELGVGAIWLSPIYKSDWKDGGYDITDYYDIDPKFGDLDDFKELVAAAYAKGIKVVMDLVVSYTSDQHEWFVESVKGQDGTDDGKYANWYVWNKGKEDSDNPGEFSFPNNWQSVFSGSAWTLNTEREMYYLHSFTENQPDLNYREEAVIKEMEKVMKHWFDLGVAGFRVDAVPQMAEDFCLQDEKENDDELGDDDYEHYTHMHNEHQPETYDIIKRWRAYADEYKYEAPGSGKADEVTDVTKVLMLETYGLIDKVVDYYGTTDKPGGHFPFNFNIITQLKQDSTAEEFNKIVHLWMDNIKPVDWPNWVLGNHDQHRVASRMGAKRVDAMNALALLLPGTAITYMGEEIGMEDHLEIPKEDWQDPWGIATDDVQKSRDPERTPFQWDDTENAGFAAEDVNTWLPVNPNYVTLNVEAQKADPKSHLNFYKKLVELRKENAFLKGKLTTKVIGDVFVFSRVLKCDTYIVAINLGAKRDVNLSELSKRAQAKVVLESNPSTEAGVERTGDDVMLNAVPLEADATMVLQTYKPAETRRKRRSRP